MAERSFTLTDSRCGICKRGLGDSPIACNICRKRWCSDKCKDVDTKKKHGHTKEKCYRMDEEVYGRGWNKAAAIKKLREEFIPFFTAMTLENKEDFQLYIEDAKDRKPDGTVGCLVQCPLSIIQGAPIEELSAADCRPFFVFMGEYSDVFKLAPEVLLKKLTSDTLKLDPENDVLMCIYWPHERILFQYAVLDAWGELEIKKTKEAKKDAEELAKAVKKGLVVNTVKKALEEK